MKKIVIIEDDASIREELNVLLYAEGYQAIEITEFDDIPTQVAALEPELILLDIGLPGKDGYALCLALRRVSAVPIMFVTSRGSSMDELKALSIGGDDFITKPYNIPVLLARIKALLRRGTSAASNDTITYDGLCLSLSKGTIDYDGQLLEVTKNEAKILFKLMQTPGEIVSRADMIEFLWDNEVYIDDNTLSVNITRLRGKLKALGLEDYIKTKRSMGYKL